MILSPMRILCGASDCSSAWASVLQAMNSTPIISARIIRLTALLPPPPTPMTRMRAKFSESERSGIGALLGVAQGRWRRTGRPHVASGWRAGPGYRRSRSGRCRARRGVYPRHVRACPRRAVTPAVRAASVGGASRTGDRVRFDVRVRVGQPGEEAQPDVAGGVVGVGVEQRDRLPGAEREPPGEDRHRERRRGQQRQHVVGAVARASRGGAIQRSSRGRSRSSVLQASVSDPAPSSRITTPAVACGHEHRQQPVAARRRRRRRTAHRPASGR